MPTPFCRDALSREISEPVYDPFTGNCYRNPCAAEEAGVLDWVPGCNVAQPTYASFDASPSWSSEVWWSGSEGGGGGGRRHHRKRHQGPWNGHDGSPDHSRRRISGGPGPGRMGRSSSGQDGPERSLMRVGGNYTGAPKRAQDGPRLVASPMYTAGVAKTSPSARYQAYGQPTARMGPAKPSYSASGQQTAGRPRGMKGLGQETVARAVLDAATAPPRTSSLPPASEFIARIGRTAGVAAGAIAFPIVVAGVVRWKSRSWTKALMAGVATVVVERAAWGAISDRTASERAPLTLPAIAYVR